MALGMVVGLGQNLAMAIHHGLCHGVPVAYSVAYLSFCKDTFITFESIRTSYLVHIGLLAMAIYGITHCCGNLVTMATEAV